MKAQFMDIICAKCGKHFSSIEAAREHRGNCRAASGDEPVHWIPARKSKVTPAEWENLMRLINSQSPATFNVGSSEKQRGNKGGHASANKSGHSGSPLTREGGSRRSDSMNKPSRRHDFRMPSWVIALLLIFALSLVGLAISAFVGTYVPFWILLGFSLILSIEKWFLYWTRRRKSVGKLYRLFLNLVILASVGIIVWSGINLFSGEFTQSPLIGSLVFLAEIAFFIWMWKVVAKNSWRWPSMKLTVFSLIIVSIVFAFAGVSPLSNYKTSISSSFSAWMHDLERSRLEREAAEQAKEKEKVAEAIAMVPAAISEALTKSPESSISTQEEMNVRQAEEAAFTLINVYRQENGAPPTVWDDQLYELSKAHTQEMATRGELFHGSGDVVGENAWGGLGYYQYNTDDLAMAIVSSWVESPLHNAWLLHAPIKESVVSIVVTPDGQYASWSFWMNKLTYGPALVEKIVSEWKSSGSELDWIPWLKTKGYLK